MGTILVIGNGGHSKVVRMIIDRSLNKRLVMLADDMIENQFEENKIIYSPLSKIKNNRNQFEESIIAIGNNQIRKKIFEQFSEINYATLIDPSSIIAHDTIVGTGSVVMPKVIINPNVRIGVHSIINSGAIVEHDCKIGDFCHISPGAVLTGGVKIDNLVHIGANATILPGIHIGEGVVIGAGAVVTKNVHKNQVMVGNPAKELGN